MKDIFDRIGESVKSTCKEMTEQTQDTLTQMKIKTDLITLKNELKKLYQKLGEDYYKNQEDSNSKQAICYKINKTLKEIECLEEKFESTMDKQKDSFDAYKRDVRATWEEDGLYTTSMSTGQEKVEVLKFCSRCNSGNTPQSLYCSTCGKAF